MGFHRHLLLEVAFHPMLESLTIQKKVRNAEVEKVPYVLVVGDKEEKAKTVAVRTRGKGKPEFGVKLDTFIKKIKKEIEERTLSP